MGSCRRTLLSTRFEVVLNVFVVKVKVVLNVFVVKGKVVVLKDCFDLLTSFQGGQL